MSELRQASCSPCPQSGWWHLLEMPERQLPCGMVHGMGLIWTGAPGANPWFPPDRCEHIRDVPDGVNFSLTTAQGVPICGRFVGTDAPGLHLTLRREWVWIGRP